MNEQQLAYMKSLNSHIKYVQEAGVDIRVDPIQLAIHDQSKFESVEFVPYAEYFYNEDGTRADLEGKVRSYSYNLAWKHHLQQNKHHWQNWIFPDGWEPEGSDIINGVMVMPERYALEMIADWMGASMAYTGSWDMGAWLKEHVPQIVVHPKTAQYLTERLIDFGYFAEMRYTQFKIPISERALNE